MENDISKSTTTNLSSISGYSVAPKGLDNAGVQDKTYIYFPNAAQNFGYYKTIPELKKAIDALASWTTGRGYSTPLSTEHKIILESLDGWGEDTIDSILWNLVVVKKIVGDSFAEIVRVDNNNPKSQLINLKPISPERMRIEVNRKGRIVQYQTWNGQEWANLPKNRVLHLCNDRIGDENHGVSVIDACKWVIDAKNEAMADWRRISHRSTIRVLYVDINNSEKINQLKNQYKEGIKSGEVLILPCKKGDAEFQDLTLPPVEAFLAWIRYLENFFYQAVGVPKIILGGADQISEGSNKMSSYNFEQVYMAEQRLLEQDFWNQVYIKIKFERPQSLMDNLAGNEAKNTSQTAFQPKDFQVTGGRE